MASDRVIRWNAERPGYSGHQWSSQGEISGLGNFGPPYAPDWNRQYPPEPYRAPRMRDDWRAGFHGGFGNSGSLGETAYNRSFESMPSQRRRGGIEPEYEPGDSHPGSWAERGFGPRGYSGGFVGHDYDWTTRGERPDYAGPHTGRGPRGYARADERIYEEVCDRLTEHGAIDASTIDVRCEQGEVTLEGTVPDRDTKRLAEEIAEGARGVRDVHNRLRIGTTGDTGPM